MKSYIHKLPDEALIDEALIMVSHERLSQLVEESADIPQLEELRSLLFELSWRRKEQEGLERTVASLRDLIELHGWHPFKGRWSIRGALAWLRQKWAL